MTIEAVQGRLFRLPDLGEGLTEAEILSWTVAVGDTVEVDQIVVEVETAKAAVEVPVPYAGTVLALHAGAGTVLAVGEPLISVAAQPDQTAAPRPAGPADDAGERYREEEQAGSGNVLIGYGTGHGATTSRRRGRAGRAGSGAGGSAGSTGSSAGSADPVAPTADGAPAAAGIAQAAATASGPRGPEAPLVVSPLVRKLARDNGVDLTRLKPSGARGVLLRRDVEQAVAALTATVEPAPARPSATDVAERVPLRGVRRAIAEKLTRSRAEIPDATTWVDADATDLLAAKDVVQALDTPARIGLVALLARICVVGLRRYPELNSSVDAARGEIVRYSQVNLGFAAQTDRGLVVPVVRGADRMTTAQLAAELARLTALARAGALPPEALTGGTFTLNNYGVFGVDGSTPIINHPEAALLGVGRIVDKPWVVDGVLAVRKMTQLSFTFDHRVCDGGVAGGFLRHVADCVERPATLLADL